MLPLGSNAVRCAGSSPVTRIKKTRLMQFDLHQPFFLYLFVTILCHALLERSAPDKLHIEALVLALTQIIRHG